jgi:hypothetical protein
MASDLIVFEVGLRRITVKDVMQSVDVGDLDQLATTASIHGSKLEALAYLSAYQIYRIYKRIEEAPDAVLRRSYRMFLGGDPHSLPGGSTGLRRAYNEAAHGWSSFDEWLTDWASGVPVSRSSAWMKVHDIEAWREEGCDWPTILNLLASVPMAAREAMDKPIKVEALPPGPDGGEPSKAEYLRELAELPPGQARKKVSEDAGEPQIYCTNASFEWTQQFGRALLLTIRLETSSEVIDYDLAVCLSDAIGRSWGAVALWLSDKLGKRIKIQ